MSVRLFSFKNWLQRRGHVQYEGDNGALITIQKELMSEYEQETVPHVIPRPRIKKYSQSLYGYVFDLVYFKLRSLPQVEFAIDFDFGPVDEDQETRILLECQSVPDFIVGTVYVYDSKMVFAERWEIQFWTSCFAEQMNWFDRHAYYYVRKKCKEVNWHIRKNFLITFHGTSICGNVHTTAVTQVMNNKDLIRCIGGFI